MTRAARFSYFFIVAVIVLAGATHLATPLITVLFSYFALRKLSFGKKKWFSVLLFFVVVAATLYGFGFLIRQAFIAFPKIAAESIPPFIAVVVDPRTTWPTDTPTPMSTTIHTPTPTNAATTDTD